MSFQILCGLFFTRRKLHRAVLQNSLNVIKSIVLSFYLQRKTENAVVLTSGEKISKEKHEPKLNMRGHKLNFCRFSCNCFRSFFLFCGATNDKQRQTLNLFVYACDLILNSFIIFRIFNTKKNTCQQASG